MADEYIEETKKRYKRDRQRLSDVESQITKLQDELQILASRLHAYGRILSYEIGDEAFKKLKSEIESEGNKAHSLEEVPSITDNLTTTQVIFSLIKTAEQDGLTAGQVISAAQNHGIGPEKRNTVYGTLNRLRMGKKIKKVGARYFAAKQVDY